MRKLATIALLVSALFTAACTEDPDDAGMGMKDCPSCGMREGHELPARPGRALHDEPLSDVVTQHDGPQSYVIVDELDGKPATAPQGDPTSGEIGDAPVGDRNAEIGVTDCRNVLEGPDHGGQQGDVLDGTMGSNQAAPRRPDHVSNQEPTSLEMLRYRVKMRRQLHLKLAGR